LTRDAHLGQVHRLIDEFEPDVLFVGPLYRLTSRAINSDDDAAPLLSALDTLRDRGVALVMEAHAGHAVSSGGDREMRPRGSAALMGWPEFGMGIRQSKVDPSTFDLVRWRGDRDQRNWPRFMKRGGVWSWTPTEL
jgi:replicative DNA helicase